MKTANWQNKDRRIHEITRRSEALSVLCKQIDIVGQLFEVMVDWMEMETAEIGRVTRDLDPEHFDKNVKPKISKAVEDWQKYTAFGTNKPELETFDHANQIDKLDAIAEFEPEPVQHFTDKELKLLE